jgi:hypothetical protein
MTRFIIPLLMFATAGYLRWYNGAHHDRKILFPFLDLLPSYQGKLLAQAELSFQLMVGLALLMLVWAAVEYLRAARRTPED